MSSEEPEVPEIEDAELQAAAQHLTQNFLCQVIQEEDGIDKKTDDEQEAGPDKDGAGPQRQAAPLAVILGKLPSAASLSLQQTFQTFNEPATGEQPDGTYYIIMTSSRTHGQVVNLFILMVCCCLWCFYR